MKLKNKIQSYFSLSYWVPIYSMNQQSVCDMQTVILVFPILLVPVLSNNLLRNNRGSVGRVNRNLVVMYTSHTYSKKMCCLLKQLKLVRLCPHAIPRRGILR